MFRFGFLIAALLALAAPPSGAQAQTTPAQAAAPPIAAPASAAAAASQTSIADLSAAVDQAETQIKAVRDATHAPDADDDTLKTQIAALPPIQASLASSLADLSQRLANVNQRLAQIGPAPAAPQTEAAEISERRRALTRLQQTVDAEVKQARLETVEAQQLLTQLTARRQQMFSLRLWKVSRSALSPRLWVEFARAIPKDAMTLRDLFAQEGVQFAGAAHRPGVVILWIVGLLAGGALLGPVRILARRFGFAQIRRLGADSRLRRSGLALWQAAVATAAPLVAGLILHGVLSDTGALTPPFDQFASLCVRILVFVMLLEGLARAILSPGQPEWRTAPIPDEVVTRLAPYPGLIALAAALSSLSAGAAGAFGASPPTYVAIDCVTLLLELAAVAASLLMLGRVRHVDEEADRPDHRLPWVLAALAAWMTIGVAVGAVLFGYLALASFLARQLIWTALVLAMLFVSSAFFDDLFPALLAPASKAGRFIRVAIGLSSRSLEPISVLLSGVSRLVLLALAWLAVTEPFGGAAGDLYGSLASGPSVLKLGQVTISPGLVLGAAAVLALGLALTRAVRGWFDKRYLPSTRLDLGARTSLSLGVTYLGGLIAVLSACAYLGVSLDKITLVASALSVGIGFGLQAIISNFISGLILLAERPIKVGDWIAIGDLEGDVRRVNVRATEIEMADRSKLIVPNSDLISKPVRNVTHGGSLGRVLIVLQIDSSVDPEHVRTVVVGLIKAHPDVLKQPEPGLYFIKVQDGAMEFQAVAYVKTPRDVYRVKSELLYKLIPALKAAKIAFPGSSTIINVTTPPMPPAPPAPSAAPAS